MKASGRMKLTGSSTGDVRIYLYNQYGEKEIENYSTGSGQYSVFVNVSKGKLKLTAYTLGESSSDIRVYIYKSDGKTVLSNWSVCDGKKYRTITLKKGTYYMKFWEWTGENEEFHYRLQLKKSKKK